MTLKHYAYYNMSRRTQLATKFVFQTLAQLSENFIFIYLGLTLFTDGTLDFKPLFIIITVVGVCIARYCAVFPLSKVINWVIRFRARKKGLAVADELPNSYQVMLFWAGLRGAVGVALAAGLKSAPDNTRALRATVLVVVVLTVIIFGGTTARMLEIMGIQTGVVEEVDSDDEFDIETAANGTYYKRGGTAFGHTPLRDEFTVKMDNVNNRANAPHSPWDDNGYSSGSNQSGPHRPSGQKRAGSINSQRERDEAARALLASRSNSLTTNDNDDAWGSDSDLPPLAPKRSPKRRASPPHEPNARQAYPTSGSTSYHGQTNAPTSNDSHLTAREVIKDLFTGTEEPAEWFKRLDDALIKPTLLLDQSSKGAGGGGSNGGSGSGSGNGNNGHSGNTTAGPSR